MTIHLQSSPFCLSVYEEQDDQSSPHVHLPNNDDYSGNLPPPSSPPSVDHNFDHPSSPNLNRHDSIFDPLEDDILDADTPVPRENDSVTLSTVQQSPDQNLNTDTQDEDIITAHSEHTTVINSLIERQIDYQNKGYGATAPNNDVKAQIDLLLILSRPGVPKHIFTDVWKWARNANNSDVHFDSSITRDGILQDLYHRYDLFPKTTVQSVVLPESR